MIESRLGYEVTTQSTGVISPKSTSNLKYSYVRGKFLEISTVIASKMGGV
jgi:hypothetical protein